MFVQNLDHPELIITWGSDFPDKLKIRKEIPLWPFRFKLRADYSRALRAFEYGCSCKVSCYGTWLCCSSMSILGRAHFGKRILAVSCTGCGLWRQNQIGCCGK